MHITLGWKSGDAGGDVIISGLGDSILSAKFNLLVAGSIEFTYKVNSASHNGLSFFIDSEEKLRVNSTTHLEWKKEHFDVEIGTHVFKWIFMHGTQSSYK